MRKVARGGWGEALIGAVIAVVGALAMGLVVALLVQFVTKETTVDTGVALPQTVGLLAYLFSRVPLRVEGSVLDLVNASSSTTFLLPILGAFAVVAMLLFRAGRRIARETGARQPLEAAMHGAKVGIPFALIAFLGAPFVGFDGIVGSIHPAAALALWWGLVYGLVFGGLGGLRFTGRLRDLAGAALVKLRGWGPAVVGSLWAMVVGVIAGGVVAVAWFIVTMVDAGAFHSIAESIVVLISVIVGAILLVPTLAIDIFAFAHGASFEASATGSLFAGVTSSVGYFSWPNTSGFVTTTGTAPWWAFLLLIIPLATSILAGYWAATLSRATKRDELNAAALRTGLSYALMLAILSLLAHGSIHGVAFLNGERLGENVGIGVSLAAALVLGLVWGSIGGLIGTRLAVGTPAVASSGVSVAPPPAGIRSAVCRNCGGPVASSDRFCNRCGTPTGGD